MVVGKLEPSQREKVAKKQQQPKFGEPIDGGACGRPEEKVFEQLHQVPVVESESAEEKFFLVGSSLGDEEKEELVKFLRANIDVFAWQPYDMPGIDAEVMCHKLHIDKKN